MITQDVMDRVIETISVAFHPRRIVLFGSQARGDADTDSDLDLLVEMETDVTPRTGPPHPLPSIPIPAPWTSWFTLPPKSNAGRKRQLPWWPRPFARTDRL